MLGYAQGGRRAKRSAEAVQSTADLIEGAVRNADGGVAITEEVRTMLEEIAQGSTKVNDLITEIATASSEQADGIKQVNAAVDEMNRVTQEAAANSEESAAASSELAGQVTELTDMLGHFDVPGIARPVSRPVVDSPRPAAPQAPRPVPARASVADPETVLPLDGEDWEDF